MRLLRRLFAVKKENKYRIIVILGIKFKLKYNERKYILEHLLCNLWYKFSKVRKNKILFINPINHQYNCNLKYIANEMISRKQDFDLVFSIHTNTKLEYFPKEFRFVPYTSIRFLWELLTAKAWICNSHMILPFMKMGGGGRKLKPSIFRHFTARWVSKKSMEMSNLYMRI